MEGLVLTFCVSKVKARCCSGSNIFHLLDPAESNVAVGNAEPSPELAD